LTVSKIGCLWMRAGGRTLPDAKSGLKHGRRCNAGREGTPVLTVVQEGSSGEEEGRPVSVAVKKYPQVARSRSPFLAS
jgi:hypothetical protein